MKKSVLIIFILAVFNLQPVYAYRDTRISEEQCSHREKRMSGVIENFKLEHQVIIGKYNRVIQNITKSLLRLEQLGYDTTNINSKLENIKVLFQEFNTDFSDFDITLGNMKTEVCSTAVGTYAAEVKSSLRLMGEKSKEILEYYKTEIKPEFELLKNKTP